MKLSNVKSIVTVAETGSIRAAATLLNKTQSALTKEILKIESEIGLSLFLRTTRGVIPAEAGLRVLSRARSIDADLTSLSEEIAYLKGQETGHIKVSAAPLAATKIIPRAIARLKQSFTDASVTVSSDLFGDAIKALREGQHDFIVGPYSHQKNYTDLVAEELLTTEIVVITSKTSRYANATSLAELTDGYWAMMGDTVGAPKMRFRKQFEQHNIEAPYIRLASESRLGLLALIEELGAISTYPKHLLQELGDQAQIVQIPIKEKLMPLQLSLITRTGRSLTPVADYFADCIRHRATLLRKEWH